MILANGGVEDTGYRRKRRFWVPTRPRLAALEPDLRGVLAAQLDAVTQWARTVDRADEARPSVLAGWTVADLLAHLARSGGTLAQLAPSSADPLPISTYVSAYAAAAADIAEGTRALAVETAADRVGAIERPGGPGWPGSTRSDTATPWSRPRAARSCCRTSSSPGWWNCSCTPTTSAALSIDRLHSTPGPRRSWQQR